MIRWTSVTHRQSDCIFGADSPFIIKGNRTKFMRSFGRCPARAVRGFGCLTNQYAIH
ncbi:Uncharacterised protein [Vibrio cholerae]|nr:Uncharacterised protein [Vibrio cholerae]CSC62088.1 Uncharacterised protein [Vibrio cholerae]CSC97784.1 Uncharacterised protein [Vibrio cholerae]CSI79334.1 Uncharacterised protein [Vibrio cholerae]